MRSPEMRIWSLALAAGLVALCVTGAAPCLAEDGASQPDQEVSSNRMDQLPRLGATSNVSVFWVGHSLVEGKATTEWGEDSLMTMVGRFAQSRGLGYAMKDHALWGSPISALWRGHPHGYDRDASSMVPKREEFERDAGKYDALVVTEALPLEASLKFEYSSYYLRRFSCTLKKANPSARVYLYQTWVNFQANDPYADFPPVQEFDWRSAMEGQRKVWERLADEATRADVPRPGFLDRIGWVSKSDGGCDVEDPIFIVPVGQAFVALAEDLASQPPGKAVKLPTGADLTVADLFSNPYIDWPRDWPLRDRAPDVDGPSVLQTLTRRKPDEPYDDIHAGPIGIYFAAVVHFATLYRQSPLGLPAPTSIGDDVARTLQCVAWKTILKDPRSGVEGDPHCEPA